MRLSARDLYRLKRAHLEAQRSALRAQLAHQSLQELVLELQRRYGLLGEVVTLEPTTGLLHVLGRHGAGPVAEREEAHEPH